MLDRQPLFDLAHTLKGYASSVQHREAFVDGYRLRMPRLRPRIFWFGPDCSWPYIKDTGPVWTEVGIKGEPHNIDSVVPHCIGHSVKSYYRLMRRLESAILWCKKRLDGWQRYAQYMLRSQAKYIAALEAEEVLRRLQD